MRKKKEQTVKLLAPGGVAKDFSIEHAERLLDMGEQLNGGWAIDPNSPYYYDEEYGVRLKPSTGNTEKAD